MIYGQIISIMSSTYQCIDSMPLNGYLGIEETKNWAVWTSRTEDTTSEAG